MMGNNSFEEVPQDGQDSNQKNDQLNSEERFIDQQFKLATHGTKMPPGPKSKVQQKFAFEGISDCEEDLNQNDAHIDSGYEGYDQKDDQKAPK